MSNFAKSLFSVAVLATMMVGCASSPQKAYSGPERAAQELANIKWVYTAANGYDGITVEKIDSYEVPFMSNSNVAAVTPGSHSLVVYCTDAKYAKLAHGSIQVDVEAGKTYLLYGKHKSSGLQAYSQSGRYMGDVVDRNSCYADVKVIEGR